MLTLRETIEDLLKMLSKDPTLGSCPVQLCCDVCGNKGGYEGASSAGVLDGPRRVEIILSK